MVIFSNSKDLWTIFEQMYLVHVSRGEKITLSYKPNHGLDPATGLRIVLGQLYLIDNRSQKYEIAQLRADFVNTL